MRKNPHKDVTAKGGDDLLPDAWDRFERAVDAAVKSGPQHRAPINSRKKGKSRSARATVRGSSRA